MSHDESNLSLAGTNLITAGPAIQSGEIDIQIATAKRFPRNVDAFIKKAITIVSTSPEIAQSCSYRLERDGKAIVGPSVRMAEIALLCWGNIRASASIVDVGKAFVTSRGFAWDLESNVAISLDQQRRITGKSGKRYGDDMIAVTANAAGAIALRNAIFKLIPQAILLPIMAKAKLIAVGDEKSLVERRITMFKKFREIGVDTKMIFALLEKETIEAINLDDLERMIGIFTAIKDGDSTVEEVFHHEEPVVTTNMPTNVQTGTKTDQLEKELAEQLEKSSTNAENGESGVIDAEVEPTAASQDVGPENANAESPAGGKKQTKSKVPAKNYLAECESFLNTHLGKPFKVYSTGEAEYRLPTNVRLRLVFRTPEEVEPNTVYVDVTKQDAEGLCDLLLSKNKA